MTSHTKTKVAVLYRVKQHWRVPIFERLAAHEKYSVKVFHGCDFPGTKVLNSKSSHTFQAKKMVSIPLRLRTSNGDALMPLSPFLFFELMRFKPDIILCEGASNLANNLQAYMYAFLFRAKTIQWGLGEIQDRQKSRTRKMLDGTIEIIERASSACLSYSNYGKRYYQRVGVKEEKTFVAVNVVDTDKIKERKAGFDVSQLFKEAHCHFDFNILFVGALTEPKRVDLLVRAFHKLQKNLDKRLSLTIVGDGPCRVKLVELVEELGIENVEFCGKVVDGVSRYFLQSDVFVLPGLGGLAVSESLAHGLPVISGVGDGCEKDLLSHGGGIFDEKLDEESLVNHLARLIENPNELSAMKDAAENTIEDVHNINTYISSVVESLDYVSEIKK